MNTVLHFATFMNLTGLGTVLVISLVVARQYPTQFFRKWLLGHGSVFAMVATEAYTQYFGRPWPVLMLQAALLFNAAWYYYQTARSLARPDRKECLYWPYMGAGMLLVTIELLLGVKFEVMAVLPLLLEVVAIFTLGITLLRQRILVGSHGNFWLGTPILLMGTMPLLYPVLRATPHLWLGFWLTGLVQIMAGVGMIIVVLDHTTTQLAERNRELLELDQMKNNFLSTVSHELRTPLTAIKGAIWLVSEGHTGPINDTQSDLMMMVRNNAERLIRLINDILDFSKMESDQMTYHFVEDDVRLAARAAAEACQQLFSDKRIAFSLILPEAPVPVPFDPDRITQVMVNLLSNAAKFTAEAGEVTLRVERQGDQIRLSVQDNGIGIPREVQPKVFTKFFQVDGGSTRKEGGTGLGLAICKAIVDRHQGRLELVSEPEKGSTFTVVLPVLMPTPSPVTA